MNMFRLMPNIISLSKRRRRPRQCLTLTLLISLSVNSACLAAPLQDEEVAITPFGTSVDDATSGMTLLELDDSLRRYADRFRTRITVATYSIRERPLTSEQNIWMQTWNSMSFSTSVNIAVGPDPITNLLDFMVLASLSRMVAEDYWVPEHLGEETGAPLLSATRALEEDIWTVANNVLTADQQRELHSLIQEWHDSNPDQVLPWLIRMNEFSGQRAQRLSTIKETGGLLKEVRRAREAAEEFQIFGERFLYYMQRSGGIMANSMETNFLQLMNGPDVQRLFGQTERFVQSTQQLAATIDRLPGEQWAVADQLLKGVASERRALITDISAAAPETQALLAELRKTVEATDRLLENRSGGDQASEPFDVNAYQALTAETANAASELRLLIQAVNDTAANAPDAVAAVDRLIDKQQQIIDYALFRLMALIGFTIVFFFMVLFAYRWIIAKHAQS